MKIPKIFAHTSYIGTTGYNNHARDFFRELLNTFKIKVRNFTVPKYFSGCDRDWENILGIFIFKN